MLSYKSNPTVIKQFLSLITGLFILLLTASAWAISQGYVSDDRELKPGMVVRLSDTSASDTPKVERAELGSADKVIGVTTIASESTVTIASGLQSIYVETSGEVSAYVSDINGEIKQGDLLTLSPLKGVLAKYQQGSTSSTGVALEDFPAGNSQSYDIDTTEGKKQTKIARMRINFDQKSHNGTGVTSALERLGASVVGKKVNEVRVIVALIIFLIVLVAEGGILYGAISSAITSLGRNPLAKEVIRKDMLKVVIIAFSVLILGLAAIYMILWV